MIRTFVAAGLGGLLLLACTEATETPASDAAKTATDAVPTETAAADTAAADSAASPCPDDGPRFPVSGVCVGRAANFLDLDEQALAMKAPDGCSWGINESAMPGGDMALLYRAATCKDVTTKLSIAGGAHSASVIYETSALYGDAARGREVMRIFTSDPADPQISIKALIDDMDEPDRSACEVQPAGRKDWPKDALVITLKDKSKLKPGEVNSVCGAFGLDEGSVKYWRIKDGYAWFIDLGQDDADFDPTSMVLLEKAPPGGR